METITKLFNWGIYRSLQLIFLHLLIFLSVELKAQRSQDSIHFQVTYKEVQPSDTLWIVVHNILYNNLDNIHHKNYRGIWHNEKQAFLFDIAVAEQSGYLTFAENDRSSGKGFYLKELLYNYFWEAGDDVAVSISFPFKDAISKSACSFNGKGAQKYLARHQVVDELRWRPIADKAAFDTRANKFIGPKPDDLMKVMAIINSYASSCSKKSIEVLKADRFCSTGYGYYRVAASLLEQLSDSSRNSLLHSFRNAFHDTDNILSDDQFRNKSPLYIQHKYYRHLVENMLENGSIKGPLLLDSIAAEKDTILRDRLIAFFCLKVKVDQPEKLYNRAESIVIDSNCKLVVAEMINRLNEKRLDNYSFYDTSGEKVFLSDYAGKVILLDFWFTGCGGCGHYYQNTLSKVEEIFKKNKGLAILSVNVDRGISVWKSGLKSGEYASEKLGKNLNTGLSGARHPMIQKLNAQAFPFVVLVNKDGSIGYTNTASLYNLESLIKIINEKI